MNICHVMFYDKFINEYIELSNNYFRNNYFLVFKTLELQNMSTEIKRKENVLILENTRINILKLKKCLNKFDKIFIHGLFDRKLMLFLFFNIKYLGKVNWIIWGGDLYYYKERQKTLKSNIYELIRRRVIKNINEITAVVKGDFEVAKEIYKTKAKYCYAFYPNPVNFRFLDESILRKHKNDNVIIQIGNSANPKNGHLEALDLVSINRNENIKIICPLSYGNKEYAKKVIQYGRNLFGDKFQPITDYLPPEKYSEFLADVDIAIFNHRRQQALGNIIALLYLGKKVWMRSDITPWNFFKGLGIQLYDTTLIKSINFQDFILNDREIGKTNRQIITKEFSEEHCIELWKKVLENKGE